MKKEKNQQMSEESFDKPHNKINSKAFNKRSQVGFNSIGLRISGLKSNIDFTTVEKSGVTLSSILADQEVSDLNTVNFGKQVMGNISDVDEVRGVTHFDDNSKAWSAGKYIDEFSGLRGAIDHEQNNSVISPLGEVDGGSMAGSELLVSTKVESHTAIDFTSSIMNTDQFNQDIDFTTAKNSGVALNSTLADQEVSDLNTVNFGKQVMGSISDTAELRGVSHLDVDTEIWSSGRYIDGIDGAIGMRGHQSDNTLISPLRKVEDDNVAGNELLISSEIQSHTTIDFSSNRISSNNFNQDLDSIPLVNFEDTSNGLLVGQDLSRLDTVNFGTRITGRMSDMDGVRSLSHLDGDNEIWSSGNFIDCTNGVVCRDGALVVDTDYESQNNNAWISEHLQPFTKNGFDHYSKREGSMMLDSSEFNNGSLKRVKRLFQELKSTNGNIVSSTEYANFEGWNITINCIQFVLNANGDITFNGDNIQIGDIIKLIK